MISDEDTFRLLGQRLHRFQQDHPVADVRVKEMPVEEAVC